jgi:2-oxoglutarate dehydrogenase E2 component (dihydrolipoamide succinyltransferase)
LIIKKIPTTKKRPVVVTVGGKDVIEIRPMMYLALTYDHRLVDGREGVTFLRRIKQLVEDPARIVVDV